MNKFYGPLFIAVLFASLNVTAQSEDTDPRSPRGGLGKNKPAPAATQSKEISDNGKSADFIVQYNVPATPVKNQAQTGTCWSFSTTSLVESQLLKNNIGNFDLSEIFTVRNIYLEKAENYLMRQGYTRFSEGALGHDQIRAFEKYGAIPENVYNGMTTDQEMHNHSELVKNLKSYLDTLLANRPIPADWRDGFVRILDKSLGAPPESFMYNGKKYTPQTFAKEVLKFNANDYVNITSFKHQPFYTSFVLDVPDNFSSGEYYNVPLNELMDILKTSVSKGYSVMWDADVSNPGFQQKAGLAMYIGSIGNSFGRNISVSSMELPWSDTARQRLFETLVTEDDHLMHIVGMEKAKDGGKVFYNVKNSWGNVGPYNGYIKVSEAYMAMNTVSIVVPRAALSPVLLNKLKK